MILENILQYIGKTPSVKLQSIGKDYACDFYAKCEFLNPGGSVKDRIAFEMVSAAERSGRIKPGDTLIEATSGNTGIGFAMVGAVKGYKVIVTMPEKMSHEKRSVITALGATIHTTPTEAAYDSPDSHISLAKKLNKQIPNSHILDQYNNSDNADVHYKYTAKEIMEDFASDLAMIVMGVGTGGTITGVAKRLKEINPNIIIIGADPEGSILGGGTEIKSYLIEGIGYDFFPKVLDNTLVDAYVKTNDKDSFVMARRIIKEEGMLVGGSSGSAMCAALQSAKQLKQGQKCLVLFPDSIRNYLTKFVDDVWMKKHNFC